MASSAEYLEYVLDLLGDIPAVTYKKMMGEYLLYSVGVLFGGVYRPLPAEGHTSRQGGVSREANPIRGS